MPISLSAAGFLPAAGFPAPRKKTTKFMGRSFDLDAGVGFCRDIIIENRSIENDYLRLLEKLLETFLKLLSQFDFYLYFKTERIACGLFVSYFLINSFSSACEF